EREREREREVDRVTTVESGEEEVAACRGNVRHVLG
ncbi:unnamed protein product, partial [Musa hybrid cultivar]